MRSTPSFTSFPKVAFETIPNVGLTDECLLSPFQGRSSSFSMPLDFRQAIDGVMSFALYMQTLSQASQHLDLPRRKLLVMVDSVSIRVNSALFSSALIPCARCPPQFRLHNQSLSPGHVHTQREGTGSQSDTSYDPKLLIKRKYLGALNAPVPNCSIPSKFSLSTLMQC